MSFTPPTPEGQLDLNSCWAASLAWWLRAVRNGRPRISQIDLIARYDRLCDENGAIPPIAILNQIFKQREFKMDANIFPTGPMKASRRLPIGDSPVIVCFNASLNGVVTSHVNVIMDQRNDSVLAMEPFYPCFGDDQDLQTKRTGILIRRPAAHYYSGSPNIILGWPHVEWN